MVTKGQSRIDVQILYCMSCQFWVIDQLVCIKPNTVQRKRFQGIGNTIFRTGFMLLSGFQLHFETG
jgi:hypothetical protein